MIATSADTLNGTIGLILDNEKGNRPLPFAFKDHNEAGAFLDVAERVGLNLWVGMNYNDLAPLVMLWRDTAKRA